jgi:hypothetical protein
MEFRRKANGVPPKSQRSFAEEAARYGRNCNGLPAWISYNLINQLHNNLIICILPNPRKNAQFAGKGAVCSKYRSFEKGIVMLFYSSFGSGLIFSGQSLQRNTYFRNMSNI